MAEPQITVTREQILRHRWHRHQLDRRRGAARASSLDVALLDVGIQDSGADGAAWALAIRGLEPSETAQERLALAWTLRGAPHAYRRSDLASVAVATAPWNEADAAKRIFDASKPLKAADIAVLDALRTLADHLRDLAATPIVKGDASGALNRLLPDPFLRECRPCKAIHIYELPFRLAALQGGLELDAGTSPPVLRRVDGLAPNRLEHLADEADPRFDVLRNAVRFWGPTTPKDAATFLDAPVREVRARWPTDAIDVAIDGVDGRSTGSVLAAELPSLTEPRDPEDAPGTLRLLAPFDPYLQLRDREVLVADVDRRRSLWPVLGRPGAVAIDGEIAAIWRPRTDRGRLTVRVEAWGDLALDDERLVEQAERLAAHRGVTLAGLEPMPAA